MHKFKRIMIMLLCSAMLAGAVPMTALAAEADSIYIGNTELKNGQYLENNSETPTNTKPSDGYAYYKDGVLTLNNYTYDGPGYNYEETTIRGKIYASIYSAEDLTVKLEGKNGIYAASNLEQTPTSVRYTDTADAIFSMKNLTVEGTGHLEVYTDNGEGLQGLKVTVNGGDISIHAGGDCSELSIGIYGTGIEINGGDINITSEQNAILSSSDNIEINGGNINVTAPMDAISACKSLKINGGTVIARSTDTQYDDSFWALEAEAGSIVLGTGVGGLAAAIPDPLPARMVEFKVENAATYDYVSLKKEKIAVSGMNITAKGLAVGLPATGVQLSENTAGVSIAPNEATGLNYALLTDNNGRPGTEFDGTFTSTGKYWLCVSLMPDADHKLDSLNAKNVTLNNTVLGNAIVSYDSSTGMATAFFPLSKLPKVTAYNISFLDGTGSAFINGYPASKAASGIKVNITAVSPGDGFRFKEWEDLNGNVSFENAYRESTSFIMPAGAVELNAVFEEILVGDIAGVEVDGIDAPVGGQTPDMTAIVPSGADYTVEAVNWYRDDSTSDKFIMTPISSSDKFEAGEDYRAEIVLKAADGKTFVRNSTGQPQVYAYLNGEPTAERGAVEGKDTSKYFGVYGYFTAEEPQETGTISSVEVSGIDMPVAGKTPDTSAKVPSGAPYSVEAVNWYRDDSTSDKFIMTPISSGDKFEAGEDYRVEVVLKAASGETFVCNTAGQPQVSAKLNGEFTAERGAVEGKDPSTYFAVYGYCTAETPTSTGTIGSVQITGITAPVAEAKPDFTAAVPSGSNYAVEQVSWKKLDGGAMGQNDQFEAGKDYQVDITLKATNGKQFVVNPDGYPTVTSKLNGEPAMPGAAVNGKSPSEYIRVSYVFTAESIQTTPMYRLYNPNSGEHFYTGSKEERDNLVKAGWQYEGIAWNAPTKTGDNVHRLFNPNNGDHHYTMSAQERDNLVKVGWKYEGVAWNSASNKNLPQYRLYNPNADCGSHHYTGSKEERDMLVKAGWKYEGIGWFGMLR